MAQPIDDRSKLLQFSVTGTHDVMSVNFGKTAFRTKAVGVEVDV